MFVQDLIEVLCAAHLSHVVESPYPERGGIMLVGAPGVLKSTFLEELDKHYHDVISMSDLNVKALTNYRDQIAAGVIKTLVFPEFAKLYERKDETAANLEGSLRAMVAEGFQAASFEDARVNRTRARCMVIGALTPATVERRFNAWEESGFTRRFLWPLIRLADPSLMDDALIQWQRLDFRVKVLPQLPVMKMTIPNETTQVERARCRSLVKYQPGGSPMQQGQILIKVLAVLRWWYRQVGRESNAMDTVERFAESLGREGAALKLEPLPSVISRSVRKQERKQAVAAAARTLQAASKRARRHK